MHEFEAKEHRRQNNKGDHHPDAAFRFRHERKGGPKAPLVRDGFRHLYEKRQAGSPACHLFFPKVMEIAR